MASNPIVNALALLGDTPDRIAETLANKGIVGYPKISARCPIANYLRDQFTFPDAVTRSAVQFVNLLPGESRLSVSVHPYNRRGQKGEICVFGFDSVLAEFVRRFDQGDYPQLYPQLVDPGHW